MQIFPQIENQAIQNAIQRHLNSSNQNINEEKKQTKENEEKIKEEIKKMTEKELNQVIDESNQEYNENQLIEMAMKESLKEVEIKKKLEEEKSLKGINISINPNTINMFKNNLNSMNPSILAVIQAGYSLDQAVMAYSVVGDDPQNMINYILDNFLNNFN